MLATLFVLGLKIPKSAGYTGSAPDATWKNLFSDPSQASGQSFDVSGRDPPTKLINVHQDFGAAKLLGF
jgi:hypothetical protein